MRCGHGGTAFDFAVVRSSVRAACHSNDGDGYGVEPICAVLPIARRCTTSVDRCPPRVRHDAELGGHVRRV